MMKKNIIFLLILLIIIVTGCVKNPAKLDTTCNTNEDCMGSCGCGCINKDEHCPGDEVKDCFWTYDCICENGFCSKIDASEITGATDCAKFKTGECQSNAVAKICSEKCYWIDNPEIIKSIDPGVKVKVIGTIRSETKECDPGGSRLCTADTPFTEYYIFIKNFKIVN